MYRKHRPRWSGNTQCVSSVFGADYDEIAKEDVQGLCSIQARQFDNYCQQITIPAGANHPPKFGDYTNLEGECDDWSTNEEEFYCLAQDCIFEYCEWVREDYLKNCLEIAGQWKTAAAEEVCKEEDDAENCIRTKKSVTVSTLNGDQSV